MSERTAKPLAQLRQGFCYVWIQERTSLTAWLAAIRMGS